MHAQRNSAAARVGLTANDCQRPASYSTGVRRADTATATASRRAVAEYIEVFFNRKRHHSTLCYRTPAQAWADHRAARPAA